MPPTVATARRRAARSVRLGAPDRLPDDRRGQLASLTDAGFAALTDAARGHVTGVRRHLFDQLSDEQVGQLRRTSEAVLAQLDAGREA